MLKLRVIYKFFSKYTSGYKIFMVVGEYSFGRRIFFLSGNIRTTAQLFLGPITENDWMKITTTIEFL